MKAGDKVTVHGVPCTIVKYQIMPDDAFREAQIALRRQLFPSDPAAGFGLCALCPCQFKGQRCTAQCGDGNKVCVIDEALPYLALEGVL